MVGVFGVVWGCFWDGSGWLRGGSSRLGLVSGGQGRSGGWLGRVRSRVERPEFENRKTAAVGVQQSCGRLRILAMVRS